VAEGVIWGIMERLSKDGRIAIRIGVIAGDIKIHAAMRPVSQTKPLFVVPMVEKFVSKCGKPTPNIALFNKVRTTGMVQENDPCGLCVDKRYRCK
jgi:hypothetical protein